MRLVQLSGHMGKIFLVPAEQDLVKVCFLHANLVFLFEHTPSCPLAHSLRS